MIEKRSHNRIGVPPADNELRDEVLAARREEIAASRNMLDQRWIATLALRLAMGHSVRAAHQELIVKKGFRLSLASVRAIARTPAFADLVRRIQDEHVGQSTAKFLAKISRHGPKQLDTLAEIAQTGTPDDSVRRGAAKDLVDTFVKVSGLAARGEAAANDPYALRPGEIRPLKLEDHETLRLREALAEAQDAEVVDSLIESEPCAKRAGRGEAPTESEAREPSEAPPNNGESESEAKPRKVSATAGNGKPKRARVTTMAELKAALAGREPPRYVETRGL